MYKTNEMHVYVIKIHSSLTFILLMSQVTNFSCRLIGLSGKQEYFKGHAI